MQQMEGYIRTTYDANDEAVLRRLVLVLVLIDQGDARLVISLVLSSASVLDLVALEVSLVLDNLDEAHC